MGDTVQSVMERAVEKQRIDPIFWRDVKGWELWQSQKMLGGPFRWGISSERLATVPGLVSDSLLLLKRWPLSLAIGGSASSSSASSPKLSSVGQPVLLLRLPHPALFSRIG